MKIIGRKVLSNTLSHVLHSGHAGLKIEGVKVVSDIYEESKDTTRYRWVLIPKQKLPFYETAFMQLACRARVMLMSVCACTCVYAYCTYKHVSVESE